MTNSTVASAQPALRRALPALKFLAVCFLIMLLGIPTMIVGFLSSDRQSSARQAARQISHQWGGGSQVLSGPYLVVPYYDITLTERTKRRKGCEGPLEDCGEKTVERRKSRAYLSVAPDVLSGSTQLATEQRYRGIYTVPVYTARTRLEGEFRPRTLRDLVDAEDEILWDEAFLSISVSDRRTFAKPVKVTWNSQTLVAEPGTVGRREQQSGKSGVHVPLPGYKAGETHGFAIELTMQGALTFGVVPNGAEVSWAIASDWPDPSFSDLFLPGERDVGETGFTARWDLPQIARQQPSVHRSAAINDVFRDVAYPGSGVYKSYAPVHGGGGEFSVGLFKPVDLYSQIDRALKYAMMFIGFVMLSLYLVELVSRDQAVHVVQYLFIGMANVVFYLLLLSFSEQIGFNLAYGIAAVATVALIAGYCRVILKERKRAAIVSVVLVAVYMLLWALLNLADYALITGSLMVFAALAVTMYATRNVNWYNPRPSATPDPVAQN